MMSAAVLTLLRDPARWEAVRPFVVGPSDREFFIDNLLIRIHFIVDMIIVDWPCAMGF